MAVIKLTTEYMTVGEAARRKRVSRAAIYQAIREGRLPSVRITGRTVILAARDVDAYAPRTRRRRKPAEDKRPIWEKIAELGREIPPEEWAKIPRDASINLEHYLYGAPRVEE